jgi:hypothetical protein
MGVTPFTLSAIMSAAYLVISTGNDFSASTFNATPTERLQTTSTTQTNFASRSTHLVGSGARSKLRLRIPGWALNSGTINANVILSGAWIECNGISKQVTFTGSNSSTLVAGTTYIQSDYVLPSDFNLTSFQLGTNVYVWLNAVAPSAGTTKVILANRVNKDTNTRLVQFNPTTTTLNFGSTGPLTASSGTDLADAVNGMTEISHALVGPFVGADKPVWALLGDSNGFGIGEDSLTAGNNIQGWFLRGLFDSDLVTQPVAALHIAQSSRKYSDFTPITSHLQSWLSAANRVIDALGTNDFGTTGTVTSLATVQSYSSTIWTMCNNAGITKIVKKHLPPRTTTNGTTEAGMTVNGTGWDTGGNCSQYNSWITTQVGLAIYSEFRSDYIYGVNPVKWSVDGVTPKYSTFDGTHLSSMGHSADAIKFRNIRSTVG